jgi:peptidyl-lysine (3S)-dioxygenase / protease
MGLTYSFVVPALIQDYYELNPSHIDELVEDPSPLEFMRYVAKNRPFVIRGGASDWTACRKWNTQYLGDIMRDRYVKVAMTPKG